MLCRMVSIYSLQIVSGGKFHQHVSGILLPSKNILSESMDFHLFIKLPLTFGGKIRKMLVDQPHLRNMANFFRNL